MQHSIRLPNGVMHCCSSVDAVFLNTKKEPVSMEFHRYLGPSFYDRNEDPIYPDIETEDGKLICAQFDGWWAAKGDMIFRNGR